MRIVLGAIVSVAFAIGTIAASGAQVAPTPAVKLASGPLITLYSRDHYNGPSLKVDGITPDVKTKGFPYPTASFVVNRGKWLLCSGKNFTGTCLTAGVGMYSADFANGFAQTITSLRPLF